MNQPLKIGPRYVKQDASGLRPFVPPEPVEGQRQALKRLKRFKPFQLFKPFNIWLILIDGLENRVIMTLVGTLAGKEKVAKVNRGEQAKL